MCGRPDGGVAPDGSGGTVPGGEEDPWGGLEIPEARNHRFFLRSMEEFREQLLPSGRREEDSEEDEHED